MSIKLWQLLLAWLVAGSSALALDFPYHGWVGGFILLFPPATIAILFAIALIMRTIRDNS
jgi:hypothetical protein